MGRLQLSQISTRAPEGFGKEETKEKLLKIGEELEELQYLLYAEHKHSVLVILQGLDASGKDGVIKKVFGRMNPQGIQVKSFKVPSEEEMDHDFLWRIHKYVPAKGMIQIFNRSQYEDILVTRVNGWCDDEAAGKRMKAINDFENLLEEQNSTTILKFYLHVSKEEQEERLEERKQDPAKQWKYNEKDHFVVQDRDRYIKYYEDCFENCNKVPWVIVPSDQNWYKEFVVANTLLHSLKKLNMKFPQIDKRS